MWEHSRSGEPKDQLGATSKELEGDLALRAPGQELIDEDMSHRCPLDAAADGHSGAEFRSRPALHLQRHANTSPGFFFYKTSNPISPRRSAVVIATRRAAAARSLDAANGLTTEPDMTAEAGPAARRPGS